MSGYPDTDPYYISPEQEAELEARERVPADMVRQLYSTLQHFVHSLKEGEEIDYHDIEEAGDLLYTVEEITGWDAEVAAEVDRQLAKAGMIPEQPKF